MRRPTTYPRKAWLAALTALLLTSCSLMTDDRRDCPTCYNPLHVTLKYDYNMHGELFNSQVQQATVYVTDAQTGRIVARDEASNTPQSQPLRSHSFAFNFEDLPEGDYRLYATCRSISSDIVAAPTLNIGDDITTLTTTIPRADAPDANGRYAVPAQELDTLWQGTDAQPLHLEPYTAAFDTISLVRITKNLSIMLMQTQNPTDCQADDYDVRIVAPDDGRIGYDNRSQTTPSLLYTPYAQWTTETYNDEETLTARTAHYDLSFARLVSHDLSADNARLQIVHRADQHTVLDIDLVYYLSLARSAAGRTYPIQEFLDREDDYRLDIILSGNEWQYMNLSISVLSWSLRIQNEKL